MAKARTDTGPGFPQIPESWSPDGRRFALSLRSLSEYILTRGWQRAYPVGAVVFNSEDKRPFSFGEWEAVTTGISGVYGWRRIK